MCSNRYSNCLEDQFFILLEDDPDKELDKKSGKETNLKPCIKSSNSDLEVKEKSLVSNSVEKKFQCDICQKLFYKNHKLTEHRVHSDEKKFQCESCGKCSVQSCDLKRQKGLTLGKNHFSVKLAMKVLLNLIH